MQKYRPTWVEINMRNLRYNLESVKKTLKKGVKIAAVVKNDAYNHGIYEICTELVEEGIDFFCVASLDEALEIKSIKPFVDVLVMGYIPISFLDRALRKGISVTIYDYSYALSVINFMKDKQKVLKVHIKIDTGFNRIGFKDEEEFLNIVKKLDSIKNICIKGIYTHLALRSTDEDYNQWYKFKDVIKKCKQEVTNMGLLHVCDSIASVDYKEFQMDMVRIGASLYGYNSTKIDLKPVMSLKSRIIQIKYIKSGEKIGYDISYVASEYTKVGVVCCGYGDGLPKGVLNKAYAYVDGKKADIIGTVCMDYCFLDLTSIECDIYDEVIFFGEIGMLDDMANAIGTNKNEILTRISKRVGRIYIE